MGNQVDRVRYIAALNLFPDPGQVGVEILAGAGCVCLGRGKIQPHGEGICEETVEFTIDESTDQPVALRVANSRYAFSGRLALVHVVVSPRLKPLPHVPAELTRALGL